ncbi:MULTISPECIES: HNH endonuclease [unclassified Micromonospora]|uniref:HNH endonuclease n=1 Tax=unclassified Micromonospora TaxID=2617518 RepID=UPI0003EEB9EF|nr:MULTISPECIES: HNH endonuclease [unclassified Micromonospora]EWM65541.1 LigA protein [Micromonospora sp. M42]MCK1806708.1 HNH endonuclease [Micromonospora sp. R42106]MCK1831258.1 HNH endonuclease [Micromonospora sp. R42003]MCK1842670.1 HNH endonuclease [Micromonospora sp. R42004]MCM1017496.1 HNH endonuclease [Micromonospora sp. XM-20-01]
MRDRERRDAGYRPQLVLQLRGGARVRGPEHYQHSIIRGVRLAEIAAELGPELPALQRLYPDGVARLWGSTPTQQVNNPKARALRERNAGDHVLFYADKVFYARARILHLFRSQAVAKRVWQTDDEGQTWEHIMALGAIEQLAHALPAEPVLRQLGLPFPLRSLTLVDADGYDSILPFLPNVPGIGSSHGRTARKRMGRKQFFRVLRQVLDESSDGSAPGIPLAMLWAIGRTAAAAEPSSHADTLTSLEAFLARHGGADKQSLLPLIDSGLWEHKQAQEWEIDRSGFHGGRASSAPDAATSDLSADVAGLLADVDMRGRAVAMLSRTLTSNVDRAAVLAQVGLAGYDSAAGTLEPNLFAPTGSGNPAERQLVTIDRIVRSSRDAKAVKQLHGHRCQICGVRLEIRDGYYSEAAHIRGLGKPHDGTDDLSNLLCLCPNHHTQFDFFALYIDEKFTVRRTSDDSRISELRRHPQHHIDQAHLRHHRRFCGLPK